jgi:hypothetical protein
LIYQHTGFDPPKNVTKKRKRQKEICDKYKDEISSLPKGSISIKKRNQKEYLYLAYRQKEKVKFNYIGPLLSDVSKDIIKKVKLRKQFEEKLKQVKSNLKNIGRQFSRDI